MIDQDGYRPNVGIILINRENLVFWGRRKGEQSWQFPQGGLMENETVEECMFRELNEELGLLAKHVEIVGKTSEWLYYDVPGNWHKQSSYRGQKQIWYLLKLVGQDYHIDLRSFAEPEFDAWRWIDYWDPIQQVVKFKQKVYKKALSYLSKYIGK